MKTKNEVQKLKLKLNQALEYDISVKSRDMEIMQARHAFANYARQNSVLSSTQIGKILERDHATILHSSKLHDKFMKGHDDKSMLYQKMWDVIVDIDLNGEITMENFETDSSIKELEMNQKNQLIKKLKDKCYKAINARKDLREKLNSYITDNSRLRTKIIKLEKKIIELEKNRGHVIEPYEPPMTIKKQRKPERKDNFGIHY